MTETNQESYDGGPVGESGSPDDLLARLLDVRDMLNRIDAALVTRDPGNARSADVFEGLRRQVVAAAQERRRLLVVLSRLQTALDSGATVDDLKPLVRDLCDDAGLQPSYAIDDTTHYDRLPPDDRSTEIHLAALVDSATGSVIRRGLATPPMQEPAQSQEDPAPTAESVAEYEQKEGPS